MNNRMANPVIGDGEETPSEAPAEKEQPEETEEKPVEKEQTPPAEIKEEAIPYHKDKRWIEMYEKAKRVDELEEKSQTLEEKLNKLEQMKSEPTKVPESFKRLFGDDPDVYGLWKAEQDEREKQLRADILKEINSQREEQAKAEEKEVEEWKEYFETEIESLKEDGFTFDADKLQKFVLDNDITDSRGVYDLKKGLLKMMNSSKANPARKSIADMTGGNKSSEPETKTYATEEDFRGPGRPW